MKSKFFLDYTQKHLNEMLALTESLVNIDSGSYCKSGIDKVASIMAEKYTEMGFSAEIIEHSDCGNGLIVRNNVSGPRVLLIGHLDTVFPEGSAVKMPFTCNGKIANGPGVLDMKSCLVNCLYAIRALYAVNQSPTIGLTVVMSGDEEIGSFHMRDRDVYEQEAKKADWAIVIEPARENGEVVIERKGGSLSERFSAW